MALRADGWVECDELIWDKMGGMPCGDNLRPRRSWERILWFANSNRPRCYPTAGMASAMSHRMGGDQGGQFRSNGWLTGAAVEFTPRSPDVLSVSTRDNGGSGNVHPAAFPLTLARRLVHMFCHPGGVVCDPFTGSGTTGDAALRLGMRFVGVERQADYVAIARDRLAGIGKHGEPVTEAQPSLFGTDAL